MIAAFSSMMAPISPTSFFLILYGSMAGVSFVGLFVAGIIPGVMIGLSLAILVFILVRSAAFKVETVTFSWRGLLKATLGAIWALVMPFIVVGGILGGFLTPTEAGIVAVVYALFYGFVLERLLTLTRLPAPPLSA